MGMTMTQKILAAHAGLTEVKAGDLIDARDLQVECVKGGLCLDAKLYGALYCLLHEAKI